MSQICNDPEQRSPASAGIDPLKLLALLTSLTFPRKRGDRPIYMLS